MTIRSAIPLLLIICFSFLQMDCKDDPPIPPIIEQPQPKREFVWSIDTLEYPGSFQTLMYDIWVDSPSNVYVVGYNDNGGFGTMYRFNGSQWDHINLVSQLPPMSFTLSAIQGFSASNIYAVGDQIYSTTTQPFIIYDSSLILHYNGATWSKVELPQRKRGLTAVYGISPSNIWAGGNRGTFYHYNGIDWKYISIPDSISISSMTHADSNSVYVTAYSFDSNQIITRYLLKINETSWTVVDSYYELEPIRFGGVLYSFNNTLYSLFPYLYKYSSGVWTVEKTIFGSSLTGMCALSEENIFLIGNKDVLIHYNGVDWYEYPKFFQNSEYVNYNAIWANGTEVIIVGNLFVNTMKTVILHGK